MGNHDQSVCWSYWVNKLTDVVLFVFRISIGISPVSSLQTTHTKKRTAMGVTKARNIHGEIDSNVYVFVFWFSVQYHRNTFNRDQIKLNEKITGKEMFRTTNLKLLRIYDFNTIRNDHEQKPQFFFVKKKIRGNWSENQFETNSVCSTWNVFKRKSRVIVQVIWWLKAISATEIANLINFHKRFVVLFYKLSRLRATFVCFIEWSNNFKVESISQYSGYFVVVVVVINLTNLLNEI